MIGEKKITEAVNAYIGYPKELGEGIETSMRRDAFRDGVEWFKEAIWHDAKEEPEEHKFIVTQWLHEGEICYEADRTQPKVDWQNHVVDNNIIKWCYVEDLLTKGGEK